MALTNTELAEALQQGNMSVFESIFRDYYERLCNYARTLVNDMDEAEEIVQGTFFNLWEKRATIEIRTAVKPYLYSAVYNSCMNHLSHQKVRKTHYDYQIHHADVTVDSGAQFAIANELEKEIDTAINELPTQCQTVFRLSRFEGLSYSEIAQHLDISVKTVENHMGKALKILRERLKDYLPLLLWLLFRNNLN